MILQRPSPVLLRSLFCSVLCGLLILHGANAVLEAGSRCGDVAGAICREGLVCTPETPGSTVRICRNSNRSPCETARCPRVWCGPNLQYVPEGECCPKCPPLPTLHTPTVTSPGCQSEDGVHHQDGESWQRDTCTTCTCQAGLPLCTSIQCEVPDNCQQLILAPGQCCPICASVSPPTPLIVSAPQCEEDGQTHEEGESWTRNGDPCTTCFCAGGEILCVAESCHVECENPLYLPDTCCPICPNSGVASNPPVPIATSFPQPPPPSIIIASPPIYCEDGGQIYENGATWNPNGDPCTSCQCEEGLVLCLATACYTECEPADHVLLPGVCCPICPGDEGYPTSGPTLISHPTSTVTNTIPEHSTSASQPTPTPTPLPPSVETATTSAPTTITTTTSTTEAPTTAPTTCKDNSGVERPNGASWCLSPHEKATCISGVISHTEHHCPPLSCQNGEPLWTPGSCDCPVCPDDEEVETVVVSAVLDMEYSHYLTVEDSVYQHLSEPLTVLGLRVVDIQAATYALKQTQVIITLSGDKTLLEEDDLTALLDLLLKSSSVVSTKVGHHKEPKSIETGASKPQVQSSSSSSSGGADKTATIAAVTLTLVIALVCAIVIVVIVTRVRRMKPIPKTTMEV